MEFDETGAPHQVVMLENKHDGKVVAINKDADNVIAKVRRHITSISISVAKCNKSVRLNLHLKWFSLILGYIHVTTTFFILTDSALISI